LYGTEKYKLSLFRVAMAGMNLEAIGQHGDKILARRIQAQPSGITFLSPYSGTAFGRTRSRLKGVGDRYRDFRTKAELRCCGAGRLEEKEFAELADRCAGSVR
jgi:hypothetical protein